MVYDSPDVLKKIYFLLSQSCKHYPTCLSNSQEKISPKIVNFLSPIPATW